MSDQHWHVALTAAFAAIVALILVAIVSGCSGQQDLAKLGQQAIDCEGERSKAVLQSKTCAEAQAQVDLLMRDHPSCQAIYRDSGIDVCAKVRKGAGHDGG